MKRVLTGIKPYANLFLSAGNQPQDQLTKKMKITYDNTASVKLQAAISQYNSNRKPSKAFKPSKATFKKALRSMSAAWIRDESEVIVGLIKGNPSRDRQSMEFAASKGWVSVQDGGKYDNYHFTNSGLAVRDEVAKTTCAFSGRRCKASF